MHMLTWFMYFGHFKTLERKLVLAVAYPIDLHVCYKRNMSTTLDLWPKEEFLVSVLPQKRKEVPVIS